MPIRWVLTVLLFASVLASCGKNDDSLPSECSSTPLRMHVERSDYIEAGGPDVRITDGLAQSTPVLRGNQARNPEDTEITDATPRTYTLYLADFHISRAKATRRTGDVVTAENLLGEVQIDSGPGTTLHAGQVLRSVEPVAGAPSGVSWFGVEYRDGDPGPIEEDTITGRVKILHLDQKTMCVDIDLLKTYRGKPTIVIRGTVSLPVVESGVIRVCPSNGGCSTKPRAA